MLEIAQQNTAKIQISIIINSVIKTKAFIEKDRLAHESDIDSTSETETHTHTHTHTHRCQPNQANALPFTLDQSKRKSNRIRIMNE